MLDLVHAPTRAAARQEQAVAPSEPSTHGEWACTIVPNPPAALLLVEHRGVFPARDVRVLLDGKPAREHPTVYVDASVPETMSLGSELAFHLVLPGSRPQFDTLEVRWVDGSGRRRACRCGVTSHAS